MTQLAPRSSSSVAPREVVRAGTHALHWRDVVALLRLGDAATIALATVAAIVLWAILPTEFVPTAFMPHWIAGSVVVWSLALSFLDGYDMVAPTFWRSSFGLVFRSLVAVLLVTAGAFFTVPFLFPRGVGLLAPFVASVALLGWRVLFARVVRTAGLRRRVLFLGADEASRRVAQMLSASRTGVSYEPVAFLSGMNDAPSDLSGLPVRRDVDRLWDIVRDLRIDEIVVGTDRSITDTGQIALVECFARGVTATSAVALYEALTGRVLVSSLGATWFAQIPTDPHRPYLLSKRVIDVLAVLVIAPFAVPLAILFALAILLDSGRPVLYRQIRLGERGVPFVIHKLRTMRAGAEDEGPRYASMADPRRTRVGLLLRRTHLDEVPQLWDVLLGRMSLIGPRPERPEFVARLRETMPLYEARFLLRPGLTGWAQVRLPYSADIEESLMKLEFDLYYVKYVGPQLDLSIALRTIGIMLRLSGR